MRVAGEFRELCWKAYVLAGGWVIPRNCLFVRLAGRCENRIWGRLEPGGVLSRVLGELEEAGQAG
jgi:hypothetical protein